MNIQAENLIDKLSNTLKAGDAILLFGPMGAGKTYFTQQLCKQMNIEEKVSSPTYTITNQYTAHEYNAHEYTAHEDISQEQTEPKYILHSDLYRLNLIDDFILETIFNTEFISIIEWAEKLSLDVLNNIPNRLHIHIDINHNIVKVEKFGSFNNL